MSRSSHPFLGLFSTSRAPASRNDSLPAGLDGGVEHIDALWAVPEDFVAVTYVDGEDRVLEIDLPGVDRDDVLIEMDNDDVLHVAALRRPRAAAVSADVDNHTPRRSYSFRYQLPAPIEQAEASASLRNGVLQIRLRGACARDRAFSVTVE